MYKALNLKYDIMTKCKHKGFMVHHFYHFLNKNAAITTQERATKNVFIPTVIVAGYAWNTTPIDGTYIIRSMLVIGWELHYPIDINMNALPTINPNNAQATLD